MMVIHLQSLDETTLARLVVRSKKKIGLDWQVRPELCVGEKLMIVDCNITQLSKSKYREYVTQACHTLNEKWLRDKATGIKCARIASEGYGRKYTSKKRILVA